MLGDPLTTDDVDLVIGEKVGWRAWGLTISYGQPLLTSPSQATLWAPGDNIAICRHATREQRQSCHCGFNAYDDRAKLEASPYGHELIVGTVNLHGEVTQYEDGYRGQYARVSELWIDRAIAQHAEDLSQRYGCPVHVEKAGSRASQSPFGMPQSALTRAQRGVNSWAQALAAAGLNAAAAPPPAPTPAPTLRQRIQSLPSRLRQLATASDKHAASDREDAHWTAQIALAFAGMLGFAVWWVMRNDRLNEQAETALMDGRKLGYWDLVASLAPAPAIAAACSIMLAATLMILIKRGKLGAMRPDSIIEASTVTLLILMVCAFAVPTINTYSHGREGAVKAGQRAWEAQVRLARDGRIQDVEITRANVRQWGAYMHELKVGRCREYTLDSARGATLEATICRTAKHHFRVGDTLLSVN